MTLGILWDVLCLILMFDDEFAFVENAFKSALICFFSLYSYN